MLAKCWNSKKVCKRLGRVLDRPYCWGQWILRKRWNVLICTCVMTFELEIFLMKSSISKDWRQEGNNPRTLRKAGRRGRVAGGSKTKPVDKLKYFGLSGATRIESLAKGHIQSFEIHSLCQPGVCRKSPREAEGDTNVAATLMLKKETHIFTKGEKCELGNLHMGTYELSH